MRGYIKSVSGDVPFFQVLGNHEQEMGWNLDDKADTSQTQPILEVNARRAIFPDPKPDSFYSGNSDASLTYIDDDHLREDYYAWTWGDAQFIVLDPYWYSMTLPQEDSTYPFGGEENPSNETRGTRWDWTLGIDQYLWLKDTLATSTATYKFVFIHHVTGGILPYGRGGTEIAGYFEWGGKNWDGTWGWDTHRPAAEGWTLPIHQLMDQYDVTIFFHGHDHFYAKQELDDIVYQEVPMPAATDGYWGFANEQTTGTYVSQYPDPDDILFYDGAEKYPDSGHLRVTVSPTEGVTVEYVDMNDGSITASYTIPAPGQSSYDLTTAVAPAGSGTIDPPAGVHSYSAGSLLNVTATPASGYSFDQLEWRMYRYRHMPGDDGDSKICHGPFLLGHGGNDILPREHRHCRRRKHPAPAWRSTPRRRLQRVTISSLSMPQTRTQIPPFSRGRFGGQHLQPGGLRGQYGATAHLHVCGLRCECFAQPAAPSPLPPAPQSQPGQRWPASSAAWRTRMCSTRPAPARAAALPVLGRDGHDRRRPMSC